MCNYLSLARQSSSSLDSITGIDAFLSGDGAGGGTGTESCDFSSAVGTGGAHADRPRLFSAARESGGLEVSGVSMCGGGDSNLSSILDISLPMMGEGAFRIFSIIYMNKVFC